MLRKPCVAGQFYPSDAKELTKSVEGYFVQTTRVKARTIISPHAGYMYSGHVAGAVYSAVEVPDTLILIGPNHTGLGKKASVMPSGDWEIPLGSLKINEELAGLLLDSSSLFSADASAHSREHSLEVQLPFIYRINSKASIVPVTVMHAGYTECEEMGRAISKAAASYGKELLIVVSSDMNHYEPDKSTRDKDNQAITEVLELDARGLLEVTSSRHITMCGVIPAAIGITAACLLGAKEARLVKYATSGDTSGDYSHVVGYAGILIK